jgi:hypothetical protein
LVLTLSRFVAEVLGHEPVFVEHLMIGRDRRSQAAQESIGKLPNGSQPERARDNNMRVRTQRYLDRLARDRPDLLGEVQAGRLKPYAAARQAGIVRVPTPLDIARGQARGSSGMNHRGSSGMNHHMSASSRSSSRSPSAGEGRRAGDAAGDP